MEKIDTRIDSCIIICVCSKNLCVIHFSTHNHLVHSVTGSDQSVLILLAEEVNKGTVGPRYVERKRNWLDIAQGRRERSDHSDLGRTKNFALCGQRLYFQTFGWTINNCPIDCLVRGFFSHGRTNLTLPLLPL